MKFFDKSTWKNFKLFKSYICRIISLMSLLFKAKFGKDNTNIFNKGLFFSIF